MAVTVTPENKMVARHAANAFGGKPRVVAYHHDHIDLSVAMLSCPDRPCDGVTCYSTIGLSDTIMLGPDGSEFPARLELAGACASRDDMFLNVLASAAFCIMRMEGRLFCPGVAIPGYVSEYFPKTTVPHLYLTAPFLWEDTLKTLDCGSKNVSWLLAIPISDKELAFLRKSGDDALEKLFEKHQIDIFDLHRPSVI